VGDGVEKVSLLPISGLKRKFTVLRDSGFLLS
jgi:hypothetical protein